MSMIKRGKSGQGITSWTKAFDDEPLLCRACHRVIPSKSDVVNGACPFCGNNPRQSDSGDVLPDPEPTE